jgi:hypothetical protein
VDLVRLRNVLGPLIVGLKDSGTHGMLPSICANLGLPSPEPSGSKRERMMASFDALSDDDLPHVAQHFLKQPRRRTSIYSHSTIIFGHGNAVI